MVNKKAAIGLSINTLVVVIISMVILTSGITLLYKFISGAEDIKSGLDQRTSEQLERLLVDQGKKVALPLHTADVQRGESNIFGLGIMNIGGAEEFTIEITLSKYVDENGEIGGLTTNDVYSWLLFDAGPHTIKENEFHKEGINVIIPKEALKGQYIFNARVFREEDGVRTQYGNTQKFTVNVV